MALGFRAFSPHGRTAWQAERLSLRAQEKVEGKPVLVPFSHSFFILPGSGLRHDAIHTLQVETEMEDVAHTREEIYVLRDNGQIL